MTTPSALGPAATAAAILVDVREREYQELIRRVDRRRAGAFAFNPQTHLVALTEQTGDGRPSLPITLDVTAAEIRSALDNPGADPASLLQTLTVQTLREFAARLVLEGAAEEYARAVSDLALAVALDSDTVA